MQAHSSDGPGRPVRSQVVPEVQVPVHPDDRHRGGPLHVQRQRRRQEQRRSRLLRNRRDSLGMCVRQDLHRFLQNPHLVHWASTPRNICLFPQVFLHLLLS